MDVRIGTTPDGLAAGFDTSSGDSLLLVGDYGRGKTTVARYLTRWWLANTSRHVHVYAHNPGEWADLSRDALEPDKLQRPIGRDCQPGKCLVVVDDNGKVAWLVDPAITGRLTNKDDGENSRVRRGTPS